MDESRQIRANPDPLLTVQGLAAREGMSERTVRDFLRRHGLPYFEANGVKIRWSEYLHWLESKRRR